MCGIVGVVRTDDGCVEAHDVERMLSLLHHRGPDGSGTCIRGPIGIGMTRLAIIDVAGGWQPIYNESGTLAIVCNGEIYNYRSLRCELEGAGHCFRTKSDVEVVLHLYEEHGEACFEKLNGMFSVAIADIEHDRVIVARDPFGQKPLYLWRGPAGWAFASELKSLTALPGFKKTVAPTALAAFLHFRYVPAPRTIFEDVQKLMPGSFCVIGADGAIRHRRYFQLDLSPEASGQQEDPDGSLTRAALMASVERHLMSERPLGVFLSGGLDSSALVACMHFNGHRDIRTFTVGFEDFWDNELETGRVVANHFGTDHHEVLLTPETFWESLDTVIYAVDEPLADPTTVPLYHLSQHASRKVVVVLSGEGSDELLAGYAGLDTMRGMFERHERFRVLSPVARAMLTLPFPAGFRHRLETLTGSAADYLARTGAATTNVFPLEFIRTVCADGVAQADLIRPLQGYYLDRQTWDGLHLYLGSMIEWWLPDDLLHKADRTTMAHSIELRCPYLDVDFARHCASLGLDSKVRPTGSEPNRKIALKKAFAGLLPPGLAIRKKRGFSMPVYEWVQTVYKTRVEREMGRNDAFSASILPRQARQHMLELATAGSLLDQRRLWSLVVLNKWADRWL